MAKSQFEQGKSHSGRFWSQCFETISKVAELRNMKNYNCIDLLSNSEMRKINGGSAKISVWQLIYSILHPGTIWA